MAKEPEGYKVEGLKILKGDVRVEADKLPNENPDYYIQQDGTQGESVDDPIEMVSDEEIRHMINSFKSAKKRKETYTENRDPLEDMEKAINHKLQSCVEEIKTIKAEIEKVILSDKDVVIKVSAWGSVFTYDPEDEDRHELLALFLFEHAIDYVRTVTFYYMKNDILLKKENTNCGEIMKKFGLSDEIKKIRTKIAACRMIDAQLEEVEGRVSTIDSLKSADAKDILEHIDGTIVAIEEMNEEYCEDLYNNVTSIRQSLKDKTETRDAFREKLVCLGQDDTW